MSVSTILASEKRGVDMLTPLTDGDIPPPTPLVKTYYLTLLILATTAGVVIFG